MKRPTEIIDADIDTEDLEPFLIKAAQFDIICMAHFSPAADDSTDRSADLFRSHAELLEMIDGLEDLRQAACLDHGALRALSSRLIGSDEDATLQWREVLLGLRDCMVVTSDGFLLPMGLKFELHRARIAKGYLSTGEID